MGAVVLLATCYYPHKLQCYPKGGKNRERLRVYVQGENIITCWVDERQGRLARIEASAELDLSGLGIPVKMGIGWSSKRRWIYEEHTPFGFGSKGQPLLPGRTFANGYRSKSDGKYRQDYPFGTRIDLDMESVHEDIRDLLHADIYKGDSFGPHDSMKDRRIDLFVRDHCGFNFRSHGGIRGVVQTPWRGVSRKATLGAQQALNLLGYKGKDGKILDEDGLPGTNTNHALASWALKHKEREKFGVWIRVWNHVIYWHLRNDAKNVKNR